MQLIFIDEFLMMNFQSEKLYFIFINLAKKISTVQFIYEAFSLK